MLDPDYYPRHLVYLFNLAGDREEIGEVICTTKRDLDALRYALKHVEYIGMEIIEMEDSTYDGTR